MPATERNGQGYLLPTGGESLIFLEEAALRRPLLPQTTAAYRKADGKHNEKANGKQTASTTEMLTESRKGGKAADNCGIQESGQQKQRKS